MPTNDLLKKNRRLTGVGKPQQEEWKCVLLLQKKQSLALFDLLQREKNGNPRFDSTPLGEVLIALQSGGRIG